MKKQLSFTIPSLLLIFILFQNCGQLESNLKTEPSQTQPTPQPTDSDETDSSASADNKVPTDNSFENQEDTKNSENTNPFLMIKKPDTTTIEANTVTIEWEMSDYSKAYIEYGLSEKLGTKNKAEETLRFYKHIQKIKDLSSNTTYYYKVVSTDKHDENIESKIYSFRTTTSSEHNTNSTNINLGFGALRPLKDRKTLSINPNAYYVAVNGNDSNDGRSQASPLKTIQVGINKLKAGQTLYVKAGNYGRQSIKVELKGTISQPITIEGYQNKPGDNPTFNDFNHNSTPKANIMPLLQGIDRKGTGATLKGSDFIFKNFQFTQQQNGILANGVERVTVDNIFVSNVGVTTHHYSGYGIVFTSAKNSVLKNSVVVNVIIMYLKILLLIKLKHSF